MRAVNLLPHVPDTHPRAQGIPSRVDRAEVIVVAAPSSGNRLLVRLLRASGKRVGFDESHGSRDLPPEKVLRLTRNPAARALSALARDDMGVFEEIITIEQAEAWVEVTDRRVADKYPDAPVVTYEALIADAQSELDRIATIIGVEKFAVSEKVVDRNAARLGEHPSSFHTDPVGPTPSPGKK